MNPHQQLDAWIDAHFDEEVRFLQALVRVPTDTPPGNNAPHAERSAELLQGFGWQVERHVVPQAEVRAAGMESITNLIVRRRFGDAGRTIALNAHGDVVPPGEGWTHDPYGGEVVDGKLYGRASAVSKSDFATYTFALRALEAVAKPARGAVELHFTYDEEFGGELGPGWLLKHGLTQPDFLIAAGFSYQVVTAHNGCLQIEVTLHGLASHAAYPSTGVDALQAAVRVARAFQAEIESVFVEDAQLFDCAAYSFVREVSLSGRHSRTVSALQMSEGLRLAAQAALALQSTRIQPFLKSSVSLIAWPNCQRPLFFFITKYTSASDSSCAWFSSAASRGSSSTTRAVENASIIAARLLSTIADTSPEIAVDRPTTSVPFGRMWSGIPIMATVDGPSEVHKVTAAKEVLKGYKPADGLWPSEWLPAKREAARQKIAMMLEHSVGNS